jgi:hypothetical protein
MVMPAPRPHAAPKTHPGVHLDVIHPDPKG